MNIDKNNKQFYPELVNFIQGSGFDQRVSIYPAFVHAKEESCIADNCFKDYVEKSEFVKQLYYEHGILCSFLNISRQQKGCIMQCADDYVIGPDGSMYKCWHHLGNEKFVVGNINTIPQITNYELLADELLNGNPLFDETCKECVLFPSCNGGCADMKNNNQDYCQPVKASMEEWLEIRYEMMKKPCRRK